MFNRIVQFSLALPLLGLATLSWACSASITSNEVLVEKADWIVRAEVEDYVVPPTPGKYRTTGVPESIVRFKVREVIWGPDLWDLELHGYVVQTDDFNDRRPPYTFVRPGGRAGSCYANSYRKGAQYLLFLKQTSTGELSVNWAPLSPVNEQLHSVDDPWVVWIRGQVSKLRN